MLNKATLIGNVGADPDIRQTNDGKEIANFSLATSESWKDKATGERKEKAEWHRVVCFNEGLTGVIKSYVRKGTKLYIEGKIVTRKWQDQSGQDRYSTEIVLENYNGTLVMLGGKEENSTAAESAPVDSHTEAKGNGFQPQPEDDDSPFK